MDSGVSIGRTQLTAVEVIGSSPVAIPKTRRRYAPTFSTYHLFWLSVVVNTTDFDSVSDSSNLSAKTVTLCVTGNADRL